ncbi:MAG: AbrB/MazE/SpoVT family DNA-binding domain-containing protein [Deltaproteobacteria bacterium]|nr:AbrB/MazE/SpoVT family DNA-binding domain-containing protein [Deltaproteobacteria bacterium]
MSRVTVSSKFQVVIPEKIRKSSGIRPGQKFEVIEFEGCLELVPIRDVRDLRGSLKGLETSVRREKKDRL